MITKLELMRALAEPTGNVTPTVEKILRLIDTIDLNEDAKIRVAVNVLAVVRISANEERAKV